MTLKKIISGGMTDTERTALKVARHSAIACEVSIDPVRDADGILIITSGPFTFQLKKIGDDFTRQKKPALHLNLKETPAHSAPYTVNPWMETNAIETLYVTGPNRFDTPDIVESTRLVLNGLLIFNEKPDPAETEGVVAEILADLSLREKSIIAHMNTIELDTLQTILDRYVDGKGIHIRDGKGVMKAVWDRLQASHRLKLVE
jgi:sulfur carrier protein ThiS